MALNEASTVYYGLQFLGLYMADELKSDKLFVVRACCVPIDEWTGPMLAEASRIIAVHRQIWVTAGQPDPTSVDGLVLRMVDQPPVGQALVDARNATPRPSVGQLAEVREFAAEMAAERKANAPRYDVELTPEMGFAVLGVSTRIFPALKTMPGYCEVDGQAQCWLCSELRDFIIANRLEADPNVLGAIVTEVSRIEGAAPWALVLEKASTCSDPDKYPAQLMSMLETMHLKGIEWRD
jgi:hypothetical protein